MAKNIEKLRAELRGFVETHGGLDFCYDNYGGFEGMVEACLKEKLLTMSEELYRKHPEVGAGQYEQFRTSIQKGRVMVS